MLSVSGPPGASVSLLVSALIVSVSPLSCQCSKGTPSHQLGVFTEKTSSPGSVSRTVQPETGLLPLFTRVSWSRKWSKPCRSLSDAKVMVTSGGGVGVCEGVGGGGGVDCAGAAGRRDAAVCAVLMLLVVERGGAGRVAPPVSRPQ